jgi:hypothetical protein
MSSDSASTQNPFCSSKGTLAASGLSLTPIIQAPTVTAFTARPDQSGTTFVLASIGATITLPAVGTCAGAHWKFVMGANGGTTAWVLTPGTSVLCGSVVQAASGSSGVIKNYANAATLTISTTSLVGDAVDITCDGVKFYVQGIGGATASFS